MVRVRVESIDLNSQDITNFGDSHPAYVAGAASATCVVETDTMHGTMGVRLVGDEVRDLTELMRRIEQRVRYEMAD